ncbi:hypothetical protein [Niveispirillum sp. KHB5.9]
MPEDVGSFIDELVARRDNVDVSAVVQAGIQFLRYVNENFKPLLKWLF